ncbi:hypothetical protein GGU11DRAFT_751645 [Lentinula aff. detonsa]|nr:hypothetical protein GGU11DRAFT_751645 [Lentinula aff. detonsa]
MFSKQHNTVAVTPSQTGLSAASGPPRQSAPNVQQMRIVERIQIARQAEAEKREERKKGRAEAQRLGALKHARESKIRHPNGGISARDSISGNQVIERGEAPSTKRSHSNGPGVNLPQVVINKKPKQADSINVDEIEPSDSDDVEVKLKFTRLPQKKNPGPQAFRPDHSQIIADHRTIVAQNNHLATQNELIIHHLSIISDSVRVQQLQDRQQGVEGGVSDTVLNINMEWLSFDA